MLLFCFVFFLALFDVMGKDSKPSKICCSNVGEKTEDKC